MKTFVTLFFLALASLGSAQQLPLFTQYREFSGIINPAAIPSDYLLYQMPISFGASYRQQWITDLSDGPNTQVLRGDYVLERRGVSLLTGGYLIRDQVARVGMTGAYGRFAGILSDGEPTERGLAFGLNVGVVRYGLDLGNAQLDPSDIVIEEVSNKIFPDVGLGVFAYTTLGDNDLLYGGLSSPQVLGLNVRFRDENNDLNIQRQRHYYATGGYKMGLGSDYSFLEISTWVKYIPPLTPHVDLNLRYQMSEILNIGLGFSTAGYVHVEAGLNWGEDRVYRVSYGFDAPFTQTSTYFGTSHEINLAIALPGQ